MKTQTARDSALALVGLAALTIYILACTSFSPDDTKVLYPTFDESSGAIGLAVYDRQTHRSETVFVPLLYHQTNRAGAMLRAQWMQDGRSVLACWPGNDDSLSLAVLPLSGGRPVRYFKVAGVKGGEAAMIMPLPVAGERAYFSESDETLVRLDLRTGKLDHFALGNSNCNITLLPAASGSEVFYYEEKNGPAGAIAFGRLHPDTLARTAAITFTNEASEGSFFAYNENGRRIAFVEKAEPDPRVVVLEAGKPPFTRSLADKIENLKFGSAVFSANGKALIASFEQQVGDKTEFGLLEIPLSDGAVRRTVLIPPFKIKDSAAALYFQMGISHDGKTAAAASTYLACFGEEFRPADCALFLVDLTDPKRKVTRVPIPLPAVRVEPTTKL